MSSIKSKINQHIKIPVEDNLNLHRKKKKRTDINSKMMQILVLSDKDFREVL